MRSEPIASRPAASSADVEVIAEPARLMAIAPEWEALVDERHPGAVFRSPAWLLPWWNAFSVGRELRVLVAREAGRAIGLLPAYRERRALGVRRLRLLGDNIVGSDYLGVLAAPDCTERAADAIAQRLLDGEEDLALDGLLPDEPLLLALDRLVNASAPRLVPTPLLPCPFARLDGDLEGFLRALPDGAGAQLKRRRRWLERQPGFRIEVARAEDEVRAAIEPLLRLHERRWAAAGGSDAIDGERVRAFHRAAAVELARRGQARIHLLSVAGEVRAACYGFVRGPRVSFYQAGNDAEWRQRRVGTVVLGAAIEDAFREGLGEFDFLRGDEPYKATFATGRRELVRARLPLGAGARGLALVDEAVAAARRAARRALPGTTVDGLRRARRALGRRLASGG